MTPTMVNKWVFFCLFVCLFVVVFLLLFFLTVKLDATNSFPSNTTEVRPVYLKMSHIMRKTCFLSYVNNKGADQPAHPRSVISAFVVRCLDSNEILQLKSYIARSLTLYLRKASYRYTYICLSLKFHSAGTVLHRFCFPVSIFCDKSF